MSYSTRSYFTKSNRKPERTALAYAWACLRILRPLHHAKRTKNSALVLMRVWMPLLSSCGQGSSVRSKWMRTFATALSVIRWIDRFLYKRSSESSSKDQRRKTRARSTTQSVSSLMLTKFCYRQSMARNLSPSWPKFRPLRLLRRSKRASTSAARNQ